MALVHSSCARQTFSSSVNLVYGSEVDDDVAVSAARELIEGIPVTARVMYRYDGLDGGSWVLEPEEAFPTYIRLTGGGRKNVWEKASGSGFDFSDRGFLRIGDVPYGRRGFEMAVEFITPITVQASGRTEVRYYVIAFACFQGPSDRGLSESQFKKAMKDGLKIYAGRTCGECPSKEPGGDNPAFTLANLQAPNASLPPVCP
jgi:hypothetical protein